MGLSLRLISLSSWLHFEFDEEVIAWKLRQFVEFGKPFLIGGGTPFGFHLGPAFYYLSAIPLFFSSMDPIGWGVFAAIFGAVTIWLMWLVGKTLYSQRIGLMAALLWATSFTAVMADRHWWPLVLDPMLSLIVILCLFYILESVKFVKFRELNNKWWIILGLVLAFAWQADLTVLPLFLAAGILAVLNFRRQWKGILAAAGILTVSVLPLVFFEFRHPGLNLGKLFGYEFLKRPGLAEARPGLISQTLVETLSFSIRSLSRLVFPITNLDGNLLKFYSWCREMVDSRVNGQPWWTTGVTSLLLLIPFIGYKLDAMKSKVSGPEGNKILQLIIVTGTAGILIFKLFGGNLYDFYLAVLYPVVILSAAGTIVFIWEKWGRIVAVSALGIIVGLNLFVIFKSYHPQGVKAKEQAVAWAILAVGKEEFDLDSMSNCSRYNGIRYLFLLGGKEPQSSFVDQDLSWLYDKKAGNMKSKYLVTFVTPDDLTPEQNEQYGRLKRVAVASKVFNSGFEVIISEHE